MKISLSEAATILGKTERQVRYLIKTGRLAARKDGNRWYVESTELPLSDGQRRAVAARVETAREAFDKGLEPAAKAGKNEKQRTHFSVTDLKAFKTGVEICRAITGELGADHAAGKELNAALKRVAQGCHCFHPADKAHHFTEARDLAATAVAELLLQPGDGEPMRRGLAERIENELIPKLAGLVASQEKRNRKSRFDRFGSFPSRTEAKR